MKATYMVGDVLAVLPTLEPGSVDTVICSPPFLALRSYLASDHPDKALEHGSEATPAAFLAQLLDVTELLGRTLAPHGSIAVELGDTFSGSGGAGGDYDEGGQRDGQPRFKARGDGGMYAGYPQGGTKHNLDIRPVTGGKSWPLPKSLCFVPSMYGASLAYGRNLLALPGTAEWREFAPWRVRNLIAWVRPNPPVGALGDKWRPATSYITVATRSATRYWDDIPTRKPWTESSMKAQGQRRSYRADPAGAGYDNDTRRLEDTRGGAPLLDWWEITPTGFTSRLGAHYATFPDAIAIPLVEAMCPRRVCRTCGTPSRRMVSEPAYVHESGRAMTDETLSSVEWRTGRGGDVTGLSGIKGDNGHYTKQQATVGWSTCGCPGTEHTRDDGFHEGGGWRPGLVLDPYAGTGTSLLVATGHGRDAIGIDLDARNAALAEERIGFFLEIKEPAA